MEVGVELVTQKNNDDLWEGDAYGDIQGSHY